MAETQNFSNHTKWHPIFHFVLAPLMLINLIYSIVRMVQDPGWDRGEFILLSIGLVVLTLLVRVNPLRAQDRVIRLEERLRLERLLDGELAEKAKDLKGGQYVALRFAPDDEVRGLVERIVKGELTEQKEIKAAIKTWRGDYHRL